MVHTEHARRLFSQSYFKALVGLYNLNSRKETNLIPERIDCRSDSWIGALVGAAGVALGIGALLAGVAGVGVAAAAVEVTAAGAGVAGVAAAAAAAAAAARAEDL